MNEEDWRSLLEDYLSDESDAETFKDAFLEAWKQAREERSRIPEQIGDLFYVVEAYDPEDGDDSDLRDEAEKALEQLNKNA